jgi:hypothetical protein
VFETVECDNWLNVPVLIGFAEIFREFLEFLK